MILAIEALSTSRDRECDHYVQFQRGHVLLPRAASEPIDLAIEGISLALSVNGEGSCVSTLAGDYRRSVARRPGIATPSYAKPGDRETPASKCSGRQNQTTSCRPGRPPMRVAAMPGKGPLRVTLWTMNEEREPSAVASGVLVSRMSGDDHCCSQIIARHLRPV